MPRKPTIPIEVQDEWMFPGAGYVKGFTYFLNKGVTKTGKPRYYFAREQKSEPVDEVPQGYEIDESVNGVVSLVKFRFMGNRDNLRERMQGFEDRYAQYSPVMRFILDNAETREYHAERWCYRGSIDDWIYAGYSGKISELAKKLIPTLGTDEFYELY